jgi:hypothetical protein
MPLEFTDLAPPVPTDTSVHQQLTVPQPLVVSGCDASYTLAIDLCFRIRQDAVFSAFSWRIGAVLNASHFWGVNFIQS